MKRFYFALIGLLTLCLGAKAENSVNIDGEEKTIHSVETGKVYGDANSFSIHLNLSKDKKEFLAIMGNIELHANGKMIYLDKYETEHPGKAYWEVRYYKNGVWVFDSKGDPTQSYDLFTNGRLFVYGGGPKNGRYGVTLSLGKITDNKHGDKETHSITVNYKTEWTPPTAPVLNIGSVSHNSIALSWDKSTDNDTPQEELKYSVLHIAPGDIGWTVDKVGNATSHTIKNLTPETTYKVQIRVNDAADNFEYSQVKIVTTAAAPCAIKVTDGKAYVQTGKNRWTMAIKAYLGTTIKLVAKKPGENKEFDRWIAENGEVTFADANASTTTFTMPKSDVSIKATYRDKAAEPGQTTFTYQGIKYGIDADGNAYVADNATASGAVTIPAIVKNGDKSYSVHSIKENAFAANTQVTSIDIQAYIRTIGARAFSKCTSLTTVKMPGYLQELNELAFEDCSSLSSIDIPSGIRLICKQTFKNCRALTSATIPETVNTIAAEAFAGCSKLKSTTFPSSLSNIGELAFAECNALESVTCRSLEPPTMTNFNAFSNNTYSNATLYAPDETYYNYQQWYGWDNFTHVQGIKVTEPTLFSYDGIQYGIDSNGDAYVAYNETASGAVTIPQTVYNGKKSYSVVEIADNAFAWNSDLSAINLQGNIKRIGDHAFFKCTALLSATLSADLAVIGTEAFSGCGKLKSIEFPESLTDIGAKAFNDCLSLETVTCRSLEPPTMADYNAFTDHTYDTATLTVPGERYYDYIQSYGWDLFAHTVTSDIEQPVQDNNKPTNIYNLQGIVVRRNATKEDLNSLPAGIYIMSGKKVIVK